MGDKAIHRRVLSVSVLVYLDTARRSPRPYNVLWVRMYGTRCTYVMLCSAYGSTRVSADKSADMSADYLPAAGSFCSSRTILGYGIHA